LPISNTQNQVAPIPGLSRPASPDPWRLLLTSFLSLYIELLLIRWIPSTLHIVAFFNNLVLIASFLGLGIGMTRSATVSRGVWQAFFRLSLLAGVLSVLSELNLTILLPEGGDYNINEMTSDSPFKVPMPAILIALFALVVWTMIPFGQLVAAYFDRLGRIRAYSINIAGSLLGVLAFSGVAWLELPPVIWFSVGLALLWLLDRQAKHFLPILLLLLVIFSQHLYDSRFNNRVYWSPYYKVLAHPLVSDGTDLHDGFIIEVNHQFLLSGLDLRDEAKPPESADLDFARNIDSLKSYYNFPFKLRPTRRVLVLGAGAGNDVAAALRHGVESVTAVEIDPTVLRLGTQFHPEKPYDSPRASIVLNDARAFLNRSNEKFDLIIFATLDAHGLLSSVGNVRLESFVYTQESLRAAKNLLTEDGLLVLSFGPFREEVQYRQYATIRSVFGQDPLYFLHANGHRTIVAGALDKMRLTELPRDWLRIEHAEIGAKLREYPHATIPATDDWPHLYIRGHWVPREYLMVLGGALLLAAVFVGMNFRGTYTLQGHFFFLGAGFLLLETKSVTEFALLIGSTWQVNSLVFVVILVMILLANLLVLTWFKRVSLPVCYGLIFASLLAGYVWPIGYWSFGTEPAVYVLTAAYLGIPIFLAAIIFASTFAYVHVGTAALASNLLGAVLGGTIEYLSLAYGIRSLSLLALTMYAGSFLFWFFQKKT
jgi:spermidine synthase